jgi:hypothetical protein
MLPHIRITPANAAQYIGREILFKSRHVWHIRTINGVSPSGKTIYIDQHDLGNNLAIETRVIYLKPMIELEPLEPGMIEPGSLEPGW